LKKSIGAGQMDRKVSFGRVFTEIDSDTGSKSSRFMYTRSNVWAKVDFFGTPSAGASEDMINDQKTGKIKIEIYVRFFADIKFEDFVVFKDRYYEVYSIQMVNNREYLVLRAEWRDDYEPLA